MNRKPLVLLCLAVLCSCSSSTPPSPEPVAKELVDRKTTKSGISWDSPEEELFQKAKGQLNSGLYSVSKDTFEALAAGHPSGAYGEFAELKAADAMIAAGDFGGSAALFEAFANNHPASVDAAYALFRTAQAYRFTGKGAQRDSSPIDKALAAADTFLKRYPDSPYAGMVRHIQAECLEILTENERHIAEFYKKRSADKAATARLTYAETQYKPLLAALKASEDTTKPLVREAKETLPATALAHSSVTPAAKPELATSVVTGEQKITRVHCEGKAIYLYLSQPLVDEAFLSSIATVHTEGDELNFKIPRATSEGIALSCLEENDLAVTKDGGFSLKGVHEAQGISLNYPPRLLITVK